MATNAAAAPRCRSGSDRRPVTGVAGSDRVPSRRSHAAVRAGHEWAGSDRGNAYAGRPRQEGTLGHQRANRARPANRANLRRPPYYECRVFARSARIQGRVRFGSNPKSQIQHPKWVAGRRPPCPRGVGVLARTHGPITNMSNRIARRAVRPSPRCLSRVSTGVSRPPNVRITKVTN